MDMNDSCDAMEMIDKLNEEHDQTFKENTDLRKLNKKLKNLDKRKRYDIRHLEEKVKEHERKEKYLTKELHASILNSKHLEDYYNHVININEKLNEKIIELMNK
jgi:hypothetical protein